jgi:MFS family permease
MLCGRAASRGSAANEAFTGAGRHPPRMAFNDTDSQVTLIGRDFRVFFGWQVVAAAFTVAFFAWGIGFYGPPIFLQTLHVGRGWPVSLISAAITSHFLLGATIVANLARLHRRFGVPSVTRAGALLTALGLLGWALASEPWQLFVATPLSGAGWAMTSGAALNAMVSPWFSRRRPAALSMAFNGATVGGVILSPLWVALIGGLGFAWAAALLAVFATTTVWLLAGRYFARSPAELGLVPDGAARASIGTPTKIHVSAQPLGQAGPFGDRRFVMLATAATLGLFAQVGLVAQLFSLLAPALGVAGAGIMMSLVSACAIGGRTLIGSIVRPGTGLRSAAALNVAIQACGSIVLLLAAGRGVPLLLIGCILFGLGLGNVTSLPPLVAQVDFTPTDVPRVVAYVTAISQAGYAFAPLTFGALRDAGQVLGLAADGQAPLLFSAAALIQVAAAGVMFFGRTEQ